MLTDTSCYSDCNSLSGLTIVQRRQQMTTSPAAIRHDVLSLSTHDAKSSLMTYHWSVSPPSTSQFIHRLSLLQVRYTRGVARNLFRRGTKQGDWDRSRPAGSRGRAMVESGPSGAKPPEAEDIYANSHCNNVLTKKP